MNAIRPLVHDDDESMLPRGFSTFVLLLTSQYATTAQLNQFFFNHRIKSRKNRPFTTRFWKRESPKIQPSIAHKFRRLPVLSDTPFESGAGWNLHGQTCTATVDWLTIHKRPASPLCTSPLPCLLWLQVPLSIRSS